MQIRNLLSCLVVVFLGDRKPVGAFLKVIHSITQFIKGGHFCCLKAFDENYRPNPLKELSRTRKSLVFRSLDINLNDHPVALQFFNKGIEATALYCDTIPELVMGVKR